MKVPILIDKYFPQKYYEFDMIFLFEVIQRIGILDTDIGRV